MRKTPYNPEHLSQRPFLCINLVHTPAPGVRTERAGWAEAGQWQTAEAPSIVTRVSNKIMENSAIIIDIAERKLIKARNYDTKDSEKIIAHFFAKYNKEVQPLIDRYEAYQELIAEIDTHGLEAVKESLDSIDNHHVETTVDLDFVDNTDAVVAERGSTPSIQWIDEASVYDPAWHQK